MKRMGARTATKSKQSCRHVQLSTQQGPRPRCKTTSCCGSSGTVSLLAWFQKMNCYPSQSSFEILSYSTRDTFRSFLVCLPLPQVGLAFDYILMWDGQTYISLEVLRAVQRSPRVRKPVITGAFSSVVSTLMSTILRQCMTIATSQTSTRLSTRSVNSRRM